VARPHRLGLAVTIFASLCGCHRREPPEVTRQRTTEQVLLKQIEDLKALVAKAEAGQLTTRDRIAIGISEDTSKVFLDASLPQEQVIGDRVRVRIEKAQPYFQGNNAILLFEASAEGLKTGAQARLELGGRLVNFKVVDGRLTADVELVHFKVLESSLANLGSGVLERLVQDNLAALGKRLPTLEIPVKLEQNIRIGGLDEGVVTAKGGVLPLAMSVADVLPLGRRLWVFLEVKAGPWQPERKGATG
jgi:ABC-type uncharacterized transport system auxiliary subunit